MPLPEPLLPLVTVIQDTELDAVQPQPEAAATDTLAVREEESIETLLGEML